MAREVKLSHLDGLLEGFEYPVERGTVVEGTRDVTVELADGTETLGGIVATSSHDTFESVTDLSSEVMNLLPRRAVSESYQSRGRGRSLT